MLPVFCAKVSVMESLDPNPFENIIRESFVRKQLQAKTMLKNANVAASPYARLWRD
jgi:hypothetical protein